MKKQNQLQNIVFISLIVLVLALAVWTIKPIPTRAATPEPDRIATGVAEAKAIAATLTADASEEDRFATRVAQAVAATLTAIGPPPNQTCIPEAVPLASATMVAGVNYGATQHCKAKAGYATIELRNIVANVKSLNLFVDKVQKITVNYGKYGCLYLEDGKYVFQWKNDSKQEQSNARSFTVNGSDAWYSGTTRPDGVRNPYDAWVDTFIPTPKPTPIPTRVPSATPVP